MDAHVFIHKHSSVLECATCGVIYRSRQHWYGNLNPEIDSVKRENKHVWPEVCILLP